MKSDQIMLQPLASGQAVLTEDEKDLGVCVIDIGGGTTDIAVYMNGAIRHTSVIPAGGNLITKDLSKSLRTPLDAAEYIKIHYGVTSCDTEGLGEMIEVPGVGDRTSRQVSSKVLAAIISARIQEIFGVVLGELQKSGFPKEVLNAGIVLTGGVSMMT
ncbi:cell division protein FtsA, partial [Klebsiella pneumoniae]|nr:cell division protein FtsA [Klebsiella pneumoniae]